MDDKVFIGGGGNDYGTAQGLSLKYANRHGLVAGATGTGKSVTLQILAEGFSDAGVPVFLSDIKGDLSGLAGSGSVDHKLNTAFTERAATIGFVDYDYRAYPVTFWDLLGEQGHPVRTTVAEMGPLLIARLLNLSEAQEGILNIAFRLSDEEGLPLLDLKDLRAVLNFVSEQRKDLSLEYGNITSQSVGAIIRNLLVLERDGADDFFGEPAIKLSDLMRTDENGLGVISVLAANELISNPRLYSTFLLWLMSELFEELPEIGDPDKPKLVFFFDEAAKEAAKEKEYDSVKRIFGILPEKKGEELLKLWEEFEFGDTKEAKFARSIDRVMPILQNLNNGKQSWTENGVGKDQILEKTAYMADGSEAVWGSIKDKIERAFE